MVTQKSWWDTVDFIASKIAGHYFIKFPDERLAAVEKWIAGENIWLIRTALLFQLHYKEDTDTHLLSKVIKSQIGSDEFFINKAIGWILRNYRRVNPNWVKAFTDQTNLHPLGRSEGLRLLKRRKMEPGVVISHTSAGSNGTNSLIIKKPSSPWG
ncbi:MAG: hypothetical protein EA411_11310 [Saprospirales bacterium]|nr:MAG: hypothetical protein EA411_11310 [Saprospirales bacterium]